MLTIPEVKREVEPPTPIFTDEEMEQIMVTNNSVKSDICALVVGDPKTAKTGVALDCRTPEEIKQGKKIVCIEMNSDNGCKINKKIFWNDDPNIIVMDPREFSVDSNTGDWNFDYVRTMAKLKAFLMYLKIHIDHWNVKAIVFDGADVFLSEVCEAQTRLEKNIDAAGGMTYAYWKNRNKYFYDVMNLLFTIDVDKYIITHFKEDVDTHEQVYKIQADFPDKTHQILEFRKDEKTGSCYVLVKSDRRNRPDILDKEFCVVEYVDGVKIWKGFKL